MQPGSERFRQLVFFSVVKLVDDSARQNTEHGAENDPVNLEIENEISDALLLVKKKKCGNVECECQQQSHENPCSQKETNDLRNSVNNWIIPLPKSLSNGEGLSRAFIFKRICQ